MSSKLNCKLNQDDYEIPVKQPTLTCVRDRRIIPSVTKGPAPDRHPAVRTYEVLDPTHQN